MVQQADAYASCAERAGGVTVRIAGPGNIQVQPGQPFRKFLNKHATADRTGCAAAAVAHIRDFGIQRFAKPWIALLLLSSGGLAGVIIPSRNRKAS